MLFPLFDIINLHFSPSTYLWKIFVFWKGTHALIETMNTFCFYASGIIQIIFLCRIITNNSHKRNARVATFFWVGQKNKFNEYGCYDSLNLLMWRCQAEYIEFFRLSLYFCVAFTETTSSASPVRLSWLLFSTTTHKSGKSLSG